MLSMQEDVDRFNEITKRLQRAAERRNKSRDIRYKIEDKVWEAQQNRRKAEIALGNDPDDPYTESRAESELRRAEANLLRRVKALYNRDCYRKGKIERELETSFLTLHRAIDDHYINVRRDYCWF